MNSKNNLYEETYRNRNHFSFGKNWQNFIQSLDEDKIKNAKKSLVKFFGEEEDVKGKTFIDIGCGSGLFSLAAYNLGAEKIVSVDVDEFSVACARYLRDGVGSPENWVIRKGSVLDEDFIDSLGTFDIVYSWGVLHHTGDMYRAFNNVISLMGLNGLFCTAVYGRRSGLMGGSPEFWLWVKRRYNNMETVGKKIVEYLYMVYFFAGTLVLLRNPIKLISNYKERGMDWRTDIRDWLGGYPYEYAWPHEIINYFGNKGIHCKKLVDKQSLACNEFLFIKRG